MTLPDNTYQPCNTVNMKRWLLLFLCLTICSLAGYTQQPPACFTFNYHKLATNKDSLLQRFEFSTFNFRDSMQAEQGNKFNWEKERLISNITGNSVDIYIYSESLAIPYKGSLVRLSLTNKYSKKSMNIFIRLAYDIGYGERISLLNLRFYPGDYFWDMCKPLPAHNNSRTPGASDKKSIDLMKIKYNKTTLKKLNTIIKDRSCF
jgi:hypothetical protein